MTKTAQGAPFQQGGTVTYQITVFNAGSAPSVGTITMQDTIPTGLTLTSVSGAGWTCTAGVPVSCTRTTAIAAGTSSVITLSANIASNAPASITNTAAVTGGGDLNTGNNSGVSVISVAAVAPDLTLTKVAQGGPFQQGGTVTYLLTVNNVGNGPTIGTITMQDTIPTGLTLTSISGAGWTCTAGVPVSCTRTTAIAAGTSSVITLNANIASNAPASITNTAAVQVSGESNSGNNSGSSVISVAAAAPDLTLTKVVQGALLQQGGAVTYLLTVSNGGNGPTTGTITVQDTIPTGLTAISATGTNWTCSLAATVTCTSTTPIAAGMSSVIALNANIAANAPASITNTATVQVSGESNTGNNSGSSVISVAAVAPDLTLTKVAQGGPFFQGGTVTYLLTANNVGNGPTTGTITVQDTLPTGLTATSATGTNWTCSLAAIVSCTRTTAIAANANSVITLVANIAANAAASITNTATVQVSGESNSGNNSGSSAISVAAVAPDLTLNKVAQGGPFQQGGIVTYLLTVNNVGNGPTTGTITVQDTIPTGLTASAASGAGWTCSVAATVSCTRTTAIAAGMSSLIMLNANIAANAPAVITNTATVQVSGESNTGNNSGSSVISVAAVAPDLTLTKVAQGGPFLLGGTVTYLLTVNNGGNGPTFGTITLQDTLPTGLTATSATGTNWNCSLAATVTCTSTTPIAANANSVITLVADIAASAPASITNTATVQVNGESNSGNNSGSSTMSVTPMPQPPQLVSVVSPKLHNGVAYDFTIDHLQPISGAISVEPRAGTGGAGSHTLVFHFGTSISSVDTAATVSDAGNMPVGSAAASVVGGDIVVALTNIPDRQRITVGLSGINGFATARASLGYLLGDVSGSRAVDSTDISAVKARSGQAVTALNFLFDVNATGVVSAADISAVKARSGTSLP